MSDTNPQIEKQLDKLASICCEKLSGEEASVSSNAETVESLLKTLLMSGYARKRKGMLQSDIEARVKKQCQETVTNRGGALSSITGQWHKQFEELSQWESKQPEEHTPPKAANISSATDA
ncbi:hypothetical protein Pla22_14500 [Rubripirellula amarantea]|uniref:Uncharacterized protein n=1 Tax=Rubripirellula amarantea TaxID=2527999 RepID=A0A5C5WT43_9BACT|nr:hypothetical protein [Rubripirellula amarantea]TWT53817.1 hypothetical protein Pla22_14500 [Rubripirellula amarantea]